MQGRLDARRVLLPRGFPPVPVPVPVPVPSHHQPIVLARPRDGGDEGFVRSSLDRSFERLHRLHLEAVHRRGARLGGAPAKRRRRRSRTPRRARARVRRVGVDVSLSLFLASHRRGSLEESRGATVGAPLGHLGEFDASALLDERRVPPEEESLGDAGETERPPASDAETRANGERLDGARLGGFGVRGYDADLLGGDEARVGLVDGVHDHPTLALGPLDALRAGQVLAAADLANPLGGVVGGEKTPQAHRPVRAGLGVGVGVAGTAIGVEVAVGALLALVQDVDAMDEGHGRVGGARALAERRHDDGDVLVVRERQGALHAAPGRGVRRELAEGETRHRSGTVKTTRRDVRSGTIDVASASRHRTWRGAAWSESTPRGGWRTTSGRPPRLARARRPVCRRAWTLGPLNREVPGWHGTWIRKVRVRFRRCSIPRDRFGVALARRGDGAISFPRQ